GAATLVLADRVELLRQHFVDHGGGKDLVLATQRKQQAIADAMRKRLVVAAKRRNEAARGKFQRAERFQGVFGQPLGQGFERLAQGGRKTEQREVAEEQADHANTAPVRSDSRASRSIV